MSCLTRRFSAINSASELRLEISRLNSYQLFFEAALCDWFARFQVDLVLEVAFEQVRHIIVIHGRFDRVSIKGILVRYPVNLAISL